MSDHKHTPGPWEVKNSTDVFTKLGAKNRHDIEAACNDGWQIADCSVGVTFDRDDQERTLKPSEQKANARLIAAAPALLEALEAVEWEGTPRGTSYGCFCMCCGNPEEDGHERSCKLGNALKLVTKSDSLPNRKIHANC
jgi:hypothetical protein